MPTSRFVVIKGEKDINTERGENDSREKKKPNHPNLPSP